MIRRYLSTRDIRVTCPALGIDLRDHFRSFTYNAAISAFELRAPRIVDGPALPDLTGQGPLVVTEMGKLACLVHFEAVTRIPFDIDVSRTVVIRSEDGDKLGQDTLVEELVILRDARIEIPKPAP